MHSIERLAQNLASESRAYGYTLTIWGGGAILINQYGTPQILEIFLYVGGALLAFGVLVALTFRNLFTDIETDSTQQLLVVSMVHVIATFGNLLVSYLLIRVCILVDVPAGVGFLALGFQTTFTYNLLLLVQDALARITVERLPIGEPSN